MTLTVLTSGNDVKEPSRPAHAAEWGRRFGLDPERVVTDSNWARTVPRHALFSPTDQTLLRRTGSLSGAELVELAGRHMDDWKEWTASGRKASWMR